MALFKKKEKAEKKKPEKQPIEIWYDADDVRIGDDGYSMTPVRSRMHNIWNGYFIYAAICAVWGCVCMVSAWFTGETFTSWELTTTGGMMINGIQLSLVLRIEALICLWTAVISVVLNIKGFHWMYDRDESTLFRVLLYGLLAISVVIDVVAMVVVHVLSPACTTSIIYILMTYFTMKKIEEERPTLKKAKKVRKEVK